MKRDDEETEEVQAPPHFAPSEEWLAEFRRQCTEALVLLTVEYANTLDAGIGSEKPQDKRYPRTLVLRALADTQLGILRWDHTTPLKTHIEKAIQKRSRIKWKRARKRARQRYRHLSIEDRIPSGRSRALDELDRMVFERLTERERASEGIAELRARAADDPDLRAYIDARCHESSRAEVLRQTGLPPERYRQVARRLGQLIKQHSIEVRPRRGRGEDTP
jgi:hypothetical protein